MSAVDSSLTKAVAPAFAQGDAPAEEPVSIQKTISTLKLQPHPEGGYFVETDRDPYQVPNPFMKPLDEVDKTKRNASTTIFYYLTPSKFKGNFHRNSARTVHTLHKGRGRYVLIHADEGGNGKKAKLETFVVGHDIANGERLQWIVEGGKYKASFLLPDVDGGAASEGLLISETVVPGFDFKDHDFLEEKAFSELVTDEQAEELAWLLSGR